ncbi:hypothetical protein [Paenibacillus graminis]|uniref:Uncharacterized protein n=1 Tax=Paenibacillus graminis TaxID=189425 RepID=A0A089M8E5_9BACL|nr:hypothetical protein [Paenibacillus graminis]AIQ69512.1 hypothetical protein PGRAT_19125 [Paenibacillus graminis]
MVKALKWVGYIVLGLAIIGGIVAGKTYGPEPEYSFEDKKFAWSYMLMFWAAGGVSAIFTLAFAALLDHVKEISDRMEKVERTTERLYNKTS